MTKQQHRRSSAATLLLAFASGLLAAQFVALLGIVSETGSSVPGREFLFVLTTMAGMGAVVGLGVTVRATSRLYRLRPLVARTVSA